MFALISVSRDDRFIARVRDGGVLIIDLILGAPEEIILFAYRADGYVSCPNLTMGIGRSQIQNNQCVAYCRLEEGHLGWAYLGLAVDEQFRDIRICLIHPSGNSDIWILSGYQNPGPLSAVVLV